jgi:cell division protease FtsH
MLLNLILIVIFFTNINETLGFQKYLNPTNIKNKRILKTISMNFLDSDLSENIETIKNSKNLFSRIEYNDLINDLINNKISNIYIDNSFKELVSIDNLPEHNFHLTKINPLVISNIVEKSSDKHIPLHFVDFTPDNINLIQNLSGEILTLAIYALPIFWILNIFSNRNNFMPGLNSKISNNKFGNNDNSFNLPFFQKKENSFVKPNVSLDSWVGSPEVIEECKEIIAYLEKKELFKEIGAEMPKGILLEGPPGSGKTLLAKAIATETNSTFISIAGSEFVQLFVGIGASRVRELFENARKNRPSIIFIDEIDAVGRQRGAGVNLANDEREQTLNQLLYEMDGFNNNDDIVVMAATNRKDVLDQALLRPGRFDRIIRVPYPDKQSREKIIEFYLSSKKTDTEFDIPAIAELTEGFSGAELKNLINEAAILSARNNEKYLQEKYIFESFEKSIVGLIRNQADTSDAVKTRVAIHESGHALLSLLFKEYFEFKKASIQPTYNGAGGYTIFTEKPEIKEGGLYTRDVLKKRLIIIMGGKAAEVIYYGANYVSLGANEDLRQANKLAQRMIGNFGMGDKLDVFFNEDVSDESNPFLGRSLALGSKYSQYTKLLMDKESLNLVKEAYKDAVILLTIHKNKLLELTELLKNNTVIMDTDVDNFRNLTY